MLVMKRPSFFLNAVVKFDGNILRRQVVVCARRKFLFLFLPLRGIRTHVLVIDNR